LEKNLHKLNKECWGILSRNPSIFELDYEALKKRCAIYKEELMQKVYHPSKLARIVVYLEEHGIGIDDLENYF
jgi:choline kinase